METTKYFPLKDNGQSENVIKARFYYELGSTDYWSSRSKPRGYYLNILPMERKEENGCICESYAPLACGGGYTLIKEVKRKSKKAEQDALELAESKLAELVDLVLKRTGFELEVGAAISLN